MARILSTLLIRLLASVIAIQLILVPLLYIQLVRVVRQSEIEQFTNDIRAYTRFLADTLEVQIDRLSTVELVDVLDSVVLSRDAVYAELRGDTLQIRSQLVDDPSREYIEDFSFGAHGDHVYYLSVPVASEVYGPVALHLGFDESTTESIIQGARHRIAYSLAAFCLISLILVAVLYMYIVKPLTILRRASRRIARGDYTEHLSVDTQILEIRDLATALDEMKTKLVTTNSQLREQMAERAKAERSRLELERSLRHTQKLETIGTLAGGIAHEINNILQVIQFYTQLAMDDLQQEDRRFNDLKHVLNSVGRARNVVNQILTFSRRSEGEGFSLVDANPILKEAVTFARELTPAAIHIECQIPHDTAPVLGDSTQLYQLFMNLLSNAQHSIPEEGGSIAVTSVTTRVSDTDPHPQLDLTPGDYVQIDIADTGHGIDPFTLERVFEPFFTTKIQGQGTGLGLSVAHGIAISHGGRIIAKSIPREGSTFSVYLPIAQADCAKLAAESTPEPDRKQAVTADETT